MKKIILALSLLMALSSKAQSVLDVVDQKLESVSKPFEYATLYGEEIADLVINSAVSDPENIMLTQTQILSNMVVATYFSDKYKLVVHVPHNPDSISFVRIYNQ